MSSLRMVYDDAGPAEMVKEETSGEWGRLEAMNKNLENIPAWSNIIIKKEMDSEEEEIKSRAGSMLVPKEEVFEEDSVAQDSLAHNSWQDCPDWMGESRERATDSFASMCDVDVSVMNGRTNESDKVKEKDEVVEKLQNGQYILIRKERSRSKVWEKFSSIFDTTMNRYVGYVQCSNCSSLLVMKLGSGTSHLSRHVCKPGSEYGFMIGSRKLKSDIYEKCVEKCVEMCARDLRPFSTVSGEGFQALGQELIKIGAVYGNVSVTSVLPKPATISQQISKMAHHVRTAMIPDIQKAIRNGVCALDLWTEEINRTHYLVVTSQYISDDWKIHRQILFTSQFPEGQNADIQIQEEILLRLRELDLSSEEIKKLRFVANESSHKKYPLVQSNYLPCIKNCLSTVISEALDEDKFLKLNTPQIMECLKVARNVVNYLKTTDLVNQPETKTVLPFWNPFAAVIDTVYSNYELIVQILIDKKEIRLLHGWNSDLISQLVAFFARFREAVSELQNSTYPTLHLVLVYVYELRGHCLQNSSDHAEIVFIKNRVKTFLEKINVSEEHYVATFLCPNTRLLKQLKSEMKEEVHKMVRKLCSKVNAQSTTDYQPQPSKKSRFGSWCQHEEDEETSFDEVALYLATGRLQSEDPSDLLLWWKEKSANFPRLSQIVRKVLCIPAASTSSEYIFNVASLSLMQTCSPVPDSMNDLLVVHSKMREEEVKKDIIPLEMSSQTM